MNIVELIQESGANYTARRCRSAHGTAFSGHAVVPAAALVDR